MPGSRRRLLLVAAVAAALVVAVAAARAVFVGPAALGPLDSGSTSGADKKKVGEHFTFCAGGFEPHGSRTVHVRSVHLTGVPDGLHVVGIWGREGGFPECGLNGDPEPALRAQLRPVTDMVFKPGAPREEWALVVVLTATEPGDWKTTGIDIDWSAGWRRGTAHYKYRFEIEATA